MKTKGVWVWVVVLSCLCTGGLAAQQTDSNSSASAINPPAASQPIPRLIMFSGTVKDLGGKPLTGPLDLNFAIYKEQTAAEPLWQETQTLNLDEQGHYTVLLGAMQQEGLPVELFTTGEARWLGVNAGKLPEQPRTLLVSVPYALKAGDAETLGGKPASAFMLAQPQQTSGSGTTLPGGLAVTPDTAKLGGGPKPNLAGTGTQYYIPMWTDSAGTLGNSVIYQKSGLVGIGTTTPAAKLDVAGSVGHFLVDTSGAQFRFTRGGANYFQAATAGGYFDFVVNGLTPSDATASLKLAVNGQVDFMAGNVGIGTLTPAQKLDVSGNLKITGAGNAIIFPDGTVQSTAGTGSGGGTVTAVTAGTGLAGGGTGGNVTLSLASSSCAAGSALTGLPLTCQPFATLGSNLFTGDQGITGKLTASGSATDLNSAILRVTQTGQSSAHWSLGNYMPAAIRGDATGGPGAGGAAGVLGTAQSNDAVGVGGFNTDGVGIQGVSIGPNFGAGVVGWCEQNASCIGVGSFLRMQGNLFEGRVATGPTDDTGVTKFTVDGSGNLAASGALSGTQLISTVASGTAPLAISSNTVVPGLNADLLDGQHAAAFQPAGSYAALGANSYTGTQTISGGDLSVTAGNVTASGSISTATGTISGARGSYSGGSADQIVSVLQSGTGSGLVGTTLGISATSAGVSGSASSTSSSSYAAGVSGYAAGFYGNGVYGAATSSHGVGVKGENLSSVWGTGVLGVSSANDSQAIGVQGQATSTGHGVGVVGTSAGTYGIGVSGSASNNIGVLGGGNVGVEGWGYQTGVYGYQLQAGIGVYGRSDHGTAIKAEVPSSGYYQSTAVLATTATSQDGTTGVYGWTSNLSGASIGVHGRSDSSNGIGVLGEATSTSFDTFGVKGTTASSLGTALAGVATGGGIGAYGESDTNVAGDFNRTDGSTSGIILQARDGSDIKFKVQGDGNVYADGTFTGGGADFAEAMAVRGDRDQYQPGDVLTIDLTSDRRLTLARDAYSPHVAGIYSTKPGILGRPYPMDDPRLGQGIPLAVVGIVPCKVSAENGPIERGDLLVTSATPGHAMKGTDRARMLGAVVGKALEPLTSGTGVIQILVTLQ